MDDREEGRLRELATDWFHRLRCDLVTEAERDEFVRWLAASPRNAVAYREISETWEELAFFEHDLRRQYALPPATQAGAVESAVRESKWLSWLVRFPRMLSAAAAAALVFAIVSVALLAPRDGIVSTQRGEQLTRTLSDGSVVHLNAKTRIVIDYSAAERAITLQDGDAVFEVAHDESRPFVVTAGAAKVRALGTAFNVTQRAYGGAVTVVKGVVQVSGLAVAGRPADPPVRLKAGGRATFTETGSISDVAQVNPHTATAWLERKLVFEHTPLKRVLEEFNRFGTNVLVIGDERLEELRITGTFDADNIDTLIEALQWIGGLHVVRISGYMTIFYLSAPA